MTDSSVTSRTSEKEEIQDKMTLQERNVTFNEIECVFNSELCLRLYERINQDHTQFLNNNKLADVAI